MWIVRIALSRPYTFVVMAMLLLILGPLSIMRTPTDIFPDINIPVIAVIWTYTGLPPEEMSGRITNLFERAITTTVNDVEHIESQSLMGVSIVKIFFQSNANIPMALSQVTAISQTVLRSMPPGVTPPLVLSYNAATVPILQLVLSSSTLPEQTLNDLATNLLRPQLATVQGAALPYPYGGKVLQIQVDLDPEAMQKNGISAQAVNAAIGAQNLIIPSGTQKIGAYEYIIKLNSSPLIIDELNNIPIRSTPGHILYLKDVAHVREGFAPQTNIVRMDGTRAVMMSIQKTGNASTLDIVKRIKALLPRLHDSLPEGLKLTQFGDQSIFVTAAIKGVIVEGIIAAALTGLMILLFLGSWRSTFIITVSIPLAILTSLIALSLLGETINIMTLGGLALAVGILVDDATVAIENINWNLEQGKEVEQAILDGAQQIAIPALVSTLCICIVFVPMFFLGGVAQYLFVPLAEAVIFAMLASYILSRTLVVTLARYLLHKASSELNTHVSPINIGKEPLRSNHYFIRFHHAFEKKFEQLRNHYKQLLSWVLNNATLFITTFLLFIGLSILLFWPWLGSDFFPSVDAGQIKLHVRAPTGTRVEETAKLIDQIDATIRKTIPAADLDSIVDNIGLPVSGINLTYSNSGTVGPADADVLISLIGGHSATDRYVVELRKRLTQQFPGVTFSFLPADIVNQILNFGIPSPINIQIMGIKKEANRRYANQLLKRIKHIPGIVDARIAQAFNYPELFIDVDRSRARDLDLTQLDIASNLLISLSGSFQTSPTFWLNPKNGVSYPIVIQTPQYYMNSLEALLKTPMMSLIMTGQPQILGAVATIKRQWVSVVESHYNVQPVIDIYAALQGRDLGSVTDDINAMIKAMKNELPKGSQVNVRGQIQTKQLAFFGLYAGLAFTILLIYLLIVVNFQSWTDPFIIIAALPAALAGIAWFLFIIHTRLSVPALTGAIMCMGIATANSILIVSFARQHLAEGHDAFTSALEAGVTRLRPVMMTALAMIIGMFPMALGLGDGGEQNAPLGRAVIGGLSFATIATLFFVPAVFSVIHGRQLTRKRHA